MAPTTASATRTSTFSCSSNLYGNSVHLNPAYQWIDDLEVWDLPPCATLPCGAPGGATSASLGSCPAPAPNVWTGCYYADQNFSTLGMVRTEPVHPLRLGDQLA